MVLLCEKVTVKEQNNLQRLQGDATAEELIAPTPKSPVVTTHDYEIVKDLTKVYL